MFINVKKPRNGFPCNHRACESSGLCSPACGAVSPIGPGQSLRHLPEHLDGLAGASPEESALAASGRGLSAGSSSLFSTVCFSAPHDFQTCLFFLFLQLNLAAFNPSNKLLIATPSVRSPVCLFSNLRAPVFAPLLFTLYLNTKTDCVVCPVMPAPQLCGHFARWMLCGRCPVLKFLLVGGSFSPSPFPGHIAKSDIIFTPVSLENSLEVVLQGSRKDRL